MTPKERAAKAIFDCSGYDEPDAYVSADWMPAARAALAAIAEPSEAMIEAIKSAWKTPHASISDNGAMVIWKAVHAAMMAEKDTGE